MFKNIEKKVKREVANSNERRRMQNINNGFQDLKAIVCGDDDGKISKAGVLRRAIDHLNVLEEYNNLLIQQNRNLKRLLSESDKGQLLYQFNSPVKRKIEGGKKKPSKCKKLKLEPEQKIEDTNRVIGITVQDMYNLRSNADKDRESFEVFLTKNETTPTSHRDESFPNRGARRSLESIIEAINQLEGEKWLNSSFDEKDL
eukprot:gene335-9994_t